MQGGSAWERVGVEFTDDVTKYEAMKLGFVNSTHLMLSVPGLAGYRLVDEALSNTTIETYLKQYMDLDVTPYLTPPPNTDFEIYKNYFLSKE